MGFEELGKKLMRLGQDTKSGVQKMGESYQINTKLTDEKKKLDQLFRAIGETVYNANKEKPLEGLEEEFEAIEAIQKNIVEYSDQLNKVKGVLYCTECGREAVKGEKFCASCGAKLPEAEDTLSEKMKQDAKEAVGEAGEIMGDVMDKAKVLVGNVADKADAFMKGMASRINGQGSDKVVLELDEDEVETKDAEDTAEGSGETAETAAEESMAETAEENLEEASEAEVAEAGNVEAEAEETEKAGSAETEAEETEAAGGTEAETEETEAAGSTEAEAEKTEAEETGDAEAEAEETEKAVEAEDE